MHQTIQCETTTEEQAFAHNEMPLYLTDFTTSLRTFSSNIIYFVSPCMTFTFVCKRSPRL